MISAAKNQPRPSFIVITAKAGVDRSTLESVLKVWGPEHGPALTPLGENRFVMSRPATKRMLAEEHWDSVRRWLQKKEGVSKAELEGADAVLAEYRGRRSPEIRSTSEFHTEYQRFDDDRTRKLRGAMDDTCPSIRLAHLDTGYTEDRGSGIAANASDRSHDVHEAAAFGLLSEPDPLTLKVEEGVNFLDPGELPPLEALSHAGSPGHGTETLNFVTRAVRAHGLPRAASGWTVIPYRVTNSVAIDTSDEGAALERAIRHAAFDAVCDVICIPLGDPCPPPPGLAEQIDAAYDAGVIIVAAAGEIAGEVAYPGRYRRVITVSGATPNRRPWRSAARGGAVDICAPATETPTATTRVIDGGDHYGTSYAAASVAGAAVLWLARHSGRPYRDWRLVEAFRTCLSESANRPDIWNDRLWGAGILDISKLLSRPLPDAAALTAAPAATVQKW